MELEMNKQVNDFVIDGIKVRFVEFHSSIIQNSISNTEEDYIKKIQLQFKSNLFKYNELKKGICQLPYFSYSRKKKTKIAISHDN